MERSPRFLVDEEGRRVAVVLDVGEYERLLAQVEELDAIRAYDAAKSAPGEQVPLEQALAEIERRRA